MEKIYTAKATATGGRNGRIRSENGALDAEVKTPKEMGGPPGSYLNPEILFAAGYAACFDSALNLVIRRDKIETGITAVTAEVSLAKFDNGAFGISVILEVDVPGVEKSKAVELVNKAHHVCPYSNATRGNVDVQLVVK